jgi:D-alanine-D-alanine ligase
LPTETPAKGDFLTAKEKFLPGDARMITPPNLSDDIVRLIQKSCVLAYKTLGLKVFSRIDGFWTGKKFVILEPNNPPAMTPSTALWHQVAETGMTAKDFLTLIIEISSKAHMNKRGPL